MPELARDQAKSLDDSDELGAFRERFVPAADPGMIAYLDGNSLGRPPVATLERITEFLSGQWASRLIRGWNEGWLDLPDAVGDRLGEVALGAAAGQVIIGDSTTVSLYKLIRAAVAARPGRDEIVTDTGNFPTDRYVVEGIADELGLRVRWLDTAACAGVTPEQVAAVAGPRTAVVTLSHVAYRSAHIADLPGITKLAHDAGALVVWDLCHSVGCMPIELDANRVDFAVGCTYKYLNAGPGAPAFMYVAAEHQHLSQPVQGWIGRHDAFAMEQGYEPAAGIRRFLSGTPPVLSLIGVAEGVELVAEAGIDRIRRKAVALTELALALADSWLVPHGFTVSSPRDPAQRGGHVTISRDDARELSEKLIAAGVIIDFRAPDGIRLGLSPLSTGFEELWQAMDVIREIAAGQ